MPQPLVSERKLGKYHILDGQLRVIRIGIIRFQT
jgi:hypothetical protein